MKLHDMMIYKKSSSSTMITESLTFQCIHHAIHEATLDEVIQCVYHVLQYLERIYPISNLLVRSSLSTSERFKKYIIDMRTKIAYDEPRSYCNIL
ncbi:hypothetical protein DFH28DRAFT_966311 [Melampsora americana]|nr:hypothetical protein DFH28DRAFT_966311 [Melampsora americana]